MPKAAVVKKRATGRPSLYKIGYRPMARKACLLGATNNDLAELFQVGETTIDEWIRKYPDFRGAVREGRQGADEEVAQALFKRAVGYSHKSEKIFMPGGNSRKPVRVQTVEHYPPDTAAAKHWLNNRRPQNWRERIEHAGDPTMPVRFILEGK